MTGDLPDFVVVLPSGNWFIHADRGRDTQVREYAINNGFVFDGSSPYLTGWFKKFPELEIDANRTERARPRCLTSTTPPWTPA